MSTQRHQRKIIKEQKLKRKNFFPTLLLTFLLCCMTVGLVYFIDPSTFMAIPLFFILIFLSILFLSSLLFASSRRGLIVSLSLSLFLILAYLGVGNIINLLLIVAIAVCIDIYLART
jgi:hypothetical protein